jgi:hypothetical protein
VNGIHEVGGSIPPGSTTSPSLTRSRLLEAIAAALRCRVSARLAAGFAAGLAMLLSGLAAAAEETQPARVAIFDFELIDTSLQGVVSGVSAEEAARLTTLGEALREAYAATPGFAVADIAPVREEAARRRLHSCRGCATRLAGEVGAELAVTGTVQKVSNLILNINVYVREVESGGLIRAASADIRGNTDESWRRGLDWLIDNRLGLERPR